MPIIKRSQFSQGHFTQISNDLAQNRSLSFDTRGMLLYLLSKPADWQCRLTDIEAEGGIGREARRRMVREAELAGYIVCQRTHGDSGRIEWDYTVYDLPVSAALRTNSGSVKPLVSVPSTGLPSVAGPSVAEPSVAEPSTANPSIYKERSTKERKTKEREREEGALAAPSRPPSPSLDFETPFNETETEGDDLSPNLPPLAEAIRKAIAWPECLSPKQYQVLLSAVKDLDRYNGQVSADVLSKAADFYRDQKGGRTWHPSFLANDWPFLKQWHDSRFGRGGSSSNPSSRHVDSSCQCGGTGRIRVGFEEIDLGGGRGLRRVPVSDFCTCAAGQSAKSSQGAPSANATL